MVSNGCESLALWALPVMALAATVAHGVPTGVKALILAAIVVGAVQWIDADGSAERTAGPLIMAAIVVAVAGGLIRVNERTSRRDEDRQNVLFNASRRFVGVNDPAELRRIAEVAATRAAAVRVGGDRRPGRPLRGGAAVARRRVGARRGAARRRGARPGGPRARRPAGAPARAAGRQRAAQHARLLPALRALALALTTALSHAELLRRLEHLSLSDPLTGLGNRRAFDEAVAEELARARRNGAPLGLVMLDVNHFKRFNDRHGHQAGDDASWPSRACSARWRAPRTGRAGWAARSSRCCCRGPTRRPPPRWRSASGRASRLHGGRADHRQPRALRRRRGEHDAGALFAQADERLYAAKQAGRNRVAGVGSPSSPAR